MNWVVSVAVCTVLTLGASLPANAQRRGTKQSAATKLEVTFSAKTRFGDTVVPPSRFRVNISRKGLSLVHPVTMVPVATLVAKESEAKDNAARPTIELVEKPDGKVEVIVHSRDRLFIATGAVDTSVTTRPEPRIDLANRPGADLGDVIPEQKTERELIEHALAKRYIKAVVHCADKAHKARWRTDDKRFWNCVCPMVDKWRLPKVAVDLRVHHPLAKGKSGLSLTVTPDGRAKDCRVWAGPKPPADETAPKSAQALPPRPPVEAAATEAEPVPDEPTPAPSEAP